MGWRNYIYVVITLVVSVLGAFGIFTWFDRSGKVPSSILNKVESPALIPGSHSGVAITKQSYKYDAADKVFSYVVTISTRSGATITEQPTPSEFVDVPDAYTKLVDQFSPFLTFDSAAGTVHVGRTLRLSGSEVAVVRSQGTLIFVHTTSDWPEVQWRRFFNNLAVAD